MIYEYTPTEHIRVYTNCIVNTVHTRIMMNDDQYC